MNANDYDRIIERYIDGALSPAEAGRFRELLAIDPDARRLLDAELAVRATFERDRDAVEVPIDGPYARFLGALAATPGSTTPTGVTPTSPATAPAGWLGITASRAIATGMLAIGLLIGGAVATRDGSIIAPGGRPDLRTPATTPAVTSPAPETAARQSVGTADDAAPRAAAETSTPSRSKWPTHASGSAGRSLPREAASVESRPTLSRTDEQLAREIDALHQRDEELPLIISDSVHGRVNLTRKPGE